MRYLLFLDKNILWRTPTPRWWNPLHLRWVWLFWCSRQGWQMDPDFHGERRHDNPPCWHLPPLHAGRERMLLGGTAHFDVRSMGACITVVTACAEGCSSLAKHIKYEVGIWKILNNSQHLNLSSAGHKSSFLLSALSASHCHVIPVAHLLWKPSLVAAPPTTAQTVSWGGDGSFCVALLCVFMEIEHVCPAVAFFMSTEFTFRI